MRRGKKMVEEGGGGGRRFEVGAPRRFSGAWKNVAPFARGGLLMGF